MALYELIEQPDLDEPLLVLALEGWIDAGLAAAGAAAVLGDAARHDHGRPLLDRRAARLPGPPPDRPPGRRRAAGPDLARDRAAGRHRRATATSCCCWWAPSPTGCGTASPTRWWPWRSTSACACASASAPTRSPRRTPGRPGWRAPPRPPGWPRAASCGRRSTSRAASRPAIEQAATSGASRRSACGRRSPTTCRPACRSRPAAWP